MAKTTIVQDLQEMERRLAQPGGWCKGAYHTYRKATQKKVDGIAVVPYDRFCLQGVIWEVGATSKARRTTLSSAIEAVLPARFERSIEGFNDDPKTKKSMVLTLIRKAARVWKRNHALSAAR